jgi:hypothetical protein
MHARRTFGAVAVCIAVICSTSQLGAQRTRDSVRAPLAFRASAPRPPRSAEVKHSRAAFTTAADEKDRRYKTILGAVIGGGIGAVIGFEAGERSDQTNPDAFAVDTPKYTAAGAVLGMLVGALVARLMP